MDDRPPVVIGAGPAGCRAAATLAAAGLAPIVLDEAPASGGQIYRRAPAGFTRPYRALYGFDAAKARRLHEAFDGIAGSIDYRPDTLVWDLRHGALHCLSGGRSRAVPYRDVILAPGARDRIIPFPGWTLPGVYTLGGAQIALKHQGCAIGGRVVFMGTGPLLYLVAYQYAKAGGGVAAVLDTTPFAAQRRAAPGLLRGGSTFAKGLWYVAALRARGIVVANGIRPVAAEGKDAVSALVYRDAAGDGTSARLRRRRLRLRAELGDAARRPGGDPVRVRSRPAAIPAGARHRRPHARPRRLPGRRRGRHRRRRRRGARRRARGARAARGSRPRGRARRASRRSSARCGRSPDSAPRWRRPFPFPADIAAGMPDETILCRCEGVTAGEFRGRRARSTPTRSTAPRPSAAAAWDVARDGSAGRPPPSCWPRRWTCRPSASAGCAASRRSSPFRWRW